MSNKIEDNMKCEFKYSNVTMVFKGGETLEEIYELHLNEFKDTIKANMGNDDALNDIKLELSEMLAIIENKIESRRKQCYTY